MSGATRPPEELVRLPGHAMATALHAREVSSRELTEAHLAVAERQNPALNAWLTLDQNSMAVAPPPFSNISSLMS